MSDKLCSLFLHLHIHICLFVPFIFGTYLMHLFFKLCCNSLSHRERVEQFNEQLGKLTELNDIPRVSAAGNG